MATRAPLTAAEQEYIRTRKLAGATLAEIARELNCSRETTRKWWRSLRKGQPPRRPGRPTVGILRTYPTVLVEQAIGFKQAHPHWGPANVKLELKRQPGLSDERLPSDARLSALFKARCPEAVQPRHRREYPNLPLPPVRYPHQRWQIDGKEKVAVGEQEVATILNIRDPAAALMIGSRAILTTTPKGWRKVTLREVQDTLRQAFSEWGRPLEVQTDHEVVYVGSNGSDCPSVFTLWLVGLGMTHLTSRDRRPTDQPQVERGHRTLGDMAWNDEDFDVVDALQTTLDDRCHRYNYELPVQAADCHGHPPLEVHPDARHSGRPFHPALEWTLFDMERVDTYLASHVWTRHVSSAGNVGLAGHLYYVGRAHLNQTVSVRFIRETRSFRFQLADGTLVNELSTVGLDQVDILGYMPIDEAVSVAFQLPLPLEGV